MDQITNLLSITLGALIALMQWALAKSEKKKEAK